MLADFFKPEFLNVCKYVQKRMKANVWQFTFKMRWPNFDILRRCSIIFSAEFICFFFNSFKSFSIFLRYMQCFSVSFSWHLMCHFSWNIKISVTIDVKKFKNIKLIRTWLLPIIGTGRNSCGSGLSIWACFHIRGSIPLGGVSKYSFIWSSSGDTSAIVFSMP